MTLVSIIIPCFNAARWLGDTLDSALSQTWPHLEIVVVDDGSTDASRDVAKRYAQHGVRLIAQENAGGCAARNRGLRETSGEYVQFLDADDLLSPRKIEAQMQRLLREPNAMATCAWTRFFGDVPRDERYVHGTLWHDLTPVEWLCRAQERVEMMPPHAFLTPRGILERAGPWNETLALNQDGEYFARVVLQSEKVLFCPDVRAFYRSGLPGSVSRTVSRRTLESGWRACESTINALLVFENSARTRRACARRLHHFAFDTYPHMPELVKQAQSRARQLDLVRAHPHGPPLFRALSRVLGWKLARRLHRALRPRNYPALQPDATGAPTQSRL